MTDICRKLMGEYLEDYIDINPKYCYSDFEIIKQGVAALVNGGIFDAEDLQRDVLRKKSVFLPLSEIKEWSEFYKD